MKSTGINIGTAFAGKYFLNGAPKLYTGIFDNFFDMQQATDNGADDDSQSNGRQIHQLIEKNTPMLIEINPAIKGKVFLNVRE